MARTMHTAVTSAADVVLSGTTVEDERRRVSQERVRECQQSGSNVMNGAVTSRRRHEWSEKGPYKLREILETTGVKAKANQAGTARARKKKGLRS